MGQGKIVFGRAAEDRIEVTPQERALIDAAVAAGKVRKVPQGVSGMPTTIYDQHLKKFITVYADGRRLHGSEIIGQRNSRIKRIKRARAAAMAAEGLPLDEIARRLGVSWTTICRYLDEIAKAGGPVADLQDAMQKGGTDA